MALESNNSVPDSSQVVQLSVDDIASILADSLVLDHASSFELRNSVDLHNRLLAMNQGAIAHRVMDVLLRGGEGGQDPSSDGPHYFFLEHPYQLMAATHVFTNVESVRGPFREKLYYLLKTTPDTTPDHQLSHERINFLIAAHDWANLSAEMEAGTIPHEYIPGVLWDSEEWEELKDEDGFWEFYEGKFIPLLVQNQDWRILVTEGYHGSRGGHQHSAVPSNVVDLLYQEYLRREPPVFREFLVEQFPDLEK